MIRRNADRSRPRDRRHRESTGSYAVTIPAGLADAAMLTCRCGGKYRDHPDSKAAHLTVFGHRPIPANTGTEDN